MSASLRTALIRLLPTLLLVLAACARTADERVTSRPSGAASQRDLRTLSFDPTALYRQMGMLARGAPFPMVGRVGFLGSASPDTTHVVLTLSFAPGALRFERETDNRFRANYTVSVQVQRDTGRALAIEATETVIVGSFRETERTDESVIFQEIFDLPPGTYRTTLALRDVSSQRGVVEEFDLLVPDFASTALSSPIPVTQILPRARRDSLPFVLVSPRATAVFGADSVLPIYIESYVAGDTELTMLARGETGRTLWIDTVRLAQFEGLSAALVEVPIARLNIGVTQLVFARMAGTDSSQAAVFVGFGSDLPITRFEDMLMFLRYFATPSRIQGLREAPEEERAAAWAAFVASTDSMPATAVHEDLRDYFARLVRANARFREEGTPGWISDRGRVFVVMGEPDQILEPTFSDFQRNRQQLWEYRNRGIQLVFFDETGTGRWRLTQASEVRFEQEFRRLLR
jgi:GWxTD domain-containing protein